MKVMILGANILQVPLIQEAVKQGYETFVVSPNPEDPGFAFAHHKMIADVKDQDGILRLARQRKIDGILTDQTDLPVRTAAYVAQELGLPGIGYETACLFTDKLKMRERCRALGMEVLPYREVASPDEAEAFFRQVGAPIIVKPLDSQGSKGVGRISRLEELRPKYEEALRYARGDTVLVEQFVTGPEFVVEGMAVNYRFRNLICGDTHYFREPDAFSANLRVFPSRRNAEVVKQVLALNEKIITGFGLKQGITHSEFIVHNGVVYLIETAARGGGVFISSDLISLSTGLRTERFLLSLATGEQKGLPGTDGALCHCCYVAFVLPVGEICRADGIQEVMRLPYTHRGNLETIQVGMRTKAFKDKTARFFITVSASSAGQLEDRIQNIKKLLAISVRTETGIRTPIWD